MSSKNSNIFFRLIALFFIFLLIFIFFFSNPISKKLKNNRYFSNIIKSDESSKIRYFVQLGVFAKPHEVDKIKSRSLILGLMPTIKKRLINGKLITRVTLGPYTSERSLNKTLKKLENHNIEYYIINE